MVERLHIADAAWLRQGPLAKLLAVLDGNGEETRVVGGAVRNALIGTPPGDVDVATTATPEEVMRRVEGAHFKVVPTGLEHGTLTVVVDGTPFEVTTLREDIETFGRHAIVRFGRDWELDAKRRDFTINALSASADGLVHDYVGGIADLKARRVRFIGNPATRIAEDYLRILRFFRFHAWYAHGPLDREGLHACIVARDGLDRLSRERVRMELLRLLLAPHAVATLTVMAESGLLLSVLGGVPMLASLSNLIKIEADYAIEASAIRRLGALNVILIEDADRLWLRLRLSKLEHERLQSIGDRWWQIAPTVDERAGRALLYQTGPEHFLDRVLIAWARSQATVRDPDWRRLATLPRRWSAPAFPLKAADLMRRGLPKGPQLGEALKAAETAWIAADFPSDSGVLGAIADAAARDLQA